MKYALCLVLVLNVLANAADLVIVPSIEKNNDDIMLSWIGGEAPFLVQQSQDLRTWTEVGSSEEAHYVIPSASDAAFFRVEGATDLGDYGGQWRIAEGEFGDALTKHRLKSIWSFYLPKDQSLVRANEFFSAATIQLQYLEDGMVTLFTGKLADLPNSSVTVADRKIEARWTWGEGDWKRDLTLEMTFRYAINAIQFGGVNLSDPTITFSAVYQVAKPNMDAGGKLTMIKSEEATLVEVDDTGDRPGWWNRSMQFTQGGVTIDSSFSIGVPLIEGGPAFIFKTPLLVEWGTTTITGLTSKPIELTDRFSQTYYPFHHNFVETLWLEPALDPAIDPEILSELTELNIRFIVPQNPSAFPNQKPSLQVMGFDHVLRSL